MKPIYQPRLRKNDTARNQQDLILTTVEIPKALRSRARRYCQSSLIPLRSLFYSALVEYLDAKEMR